MHPRTEESNHVSVSVVLPIHNERPNLAPLMAEIVSALGESEFEIVAVDDGSDDDTAGELRRLRREHPQLVVITLPERSGQSAALLAGCDAARGASIVTMDADGQNDPADLAALFEAGEARPGSAVVGYRVNREVGAWKRVQSVVANWGRNVITGDRVRDTGCSLRLVPRAVMLALPRFDGMHRFLPTLIRRAGVPVIEVPVRDRPRRFGRSHYGAVDRAWRGWRDAWGVRWLRQRRLQDRPTAGDRE